MDISQTEYNNLLRFAKNKIRDFPSFPLTEYDLVHEALCQNKKSFKSAILDALHGELRRNSKFSQLKYEPPAVIKSPAIPATKQEKQFKKIPKSKRLTKEEREQLKNELLPGKKVCLGCQQELTAAHFALHYSKQRNTYFVSGRCSRCIANQSNVYYQSVRTTKKFKAKSKKRSSDRWKATKADKTLHEAHKVYNRKLYKDRLAQPENRQQERERQETRKATHQQKMKEDPVYVKEYKAKIKVYHQNYYRKKKGQKGKEDKP